MKKKNVQVHLFGMDNVIEEESKNVDNTKKDDKRKFLKFALKAIQINGYLQPMT